ncbi:MAG: hypothetical protein ACO1PZ_07595 [Gammaproteobacteria bacterium]
MNLYRPTTKTILNTAFTAVMLGCSLHAGATDFSLQNSSVIVSSATSAATVTVDASGSAPLPAVFVPIGTQGYGMPTFDIDLQASNVQAGEYIFWAAVLITGNNNDKYVRAFTDEVYLTVAEDGTITGRVNPTSNLTIKIDSQGESIQEEVNDIADDNITFSGNRLSFNASNVFELVGVASGQSALYQRIAEDFRSADNFTYKVFLGPREYGAQGARVGITSNGTFTAFPLKAAQIVPGNAYVIEGQLNTTAAVSRIDVSQQVLLDVAKSPSTLLRSRDSATGLDVGIPDGLFLYGASKDRGATTSTTFREGDNIIIAASVLPQAADIGRAADIFIVVRTTTAVSDTWTYRDTNGLFVPWTTVMNDLRPADHVSSLKDIEAFEVFAGTLIPAQHRVYVGYRLIGGTELLYTGQALSLNVTN